MKSEGTPPRCAACGQKLFNHRPASNLRRTEPRSILRPNRACKNPPYEAPPHDAALKPQRRFLTFIFVACLWILPASARAQSNIEKIKTAYAAVSAKLEKHLVHGAWLDDDPESPKLLALQWSLAGEWVAAWLNAHPHAGPAGVKAAIAELAPSSIPQYLALNTGTFLVVSPSPVGNVFIVSKSGDDYRLAWSTAQRQETSGKSAEVLAAWRPENARSGARGPYWAASGSAGSVDELFYRVINHKSAADVAAPAAVKAAKALVECARRDVSEQVWKKFPSLGMMGDWSVTSNKNAEDLCLELDNGGTNIFKLRPVGESFFITSVTKTDSCSRHSRDSSARL